jgi:hypothetical protein
MKQLSRDLIGGTLIEFSVFLGDDLGRKSQDKGVSCSGVRQLVETTTGGFEAAIRSQGLPDLGTELVRRED